MSERRHALQDFWPFDVRTTHAILASSVALAVLTFVVTLKAVFTPFFIALILAYIFNPVVNLGVRLSIPRWASTLAIFSLFWLVVLVFALFVVPSVLQESRDLLSKFDLNRPAYGEWFQQAKSWAHGYLSPEMTERIGGHIKNSMDQLWSYSQETARNALQRLGRAVLPGIYTLLMTSISLLFIAFYFFFLLTHLESIWKFILTYLVPFDYRTTFNRVSYKIHLSLSAFFRGRLIICLIIGTSAYIGMLFLKVPFPFLLGFGIGFATIIPMFGLVFLFPALGLYTLDGAGIHDLIWLLALYFFVQGMEMFLTPWLLGREVELHPLVLVLAIVVCGSLFGAIGVLLAVPIAATTKLLFYEFIFPSFLALSEHGTEKPPTGV